MKSLHMPGFNSGALAEILKSYDVKAPDAMGRPGDRSTMIDTTMRSANMKGEDVSSLMYPNTSYNMFGNIKDSAIDDIRERRDDRRSFENAINNVSMDKSKEFLQNFFPGLEVRDEKGAIDFSKLDVTFGAALYAGDQGMDNMDDLGM
jgi:hypothetical protein